LENNLNNNNNNKEYVTYNHNEKPSIKTLSQIKRLNPNINSLKDNLNLSGIAKQGK